MMLGADGVANLLIARMRERIPTNLAEIRALNHLNTVTLPDPNHYKPTEPIRLPISDWPMIYAEIEDTNPGKGSTYRESVGSHFDVFGFRYSCRLYACCRTMTSAIDGDSVEAQLRHYLLAMRVAVLQGLILLQADDYGQHAKTDPNTIKERFGPAQYGEGAETIASGRLEFEVVTTEAIGATPAPSDNETEYDPPAFTLTGLTEPLSPSTGMAP